MAKPAGEPVDGPLRLDFDRRLKLEFHGCGITTDAGWPAMSLSIRAPARTVGTR